MAAHLTVRGIDALKPTISRQEIADGYLTGLYLIVQPSGAKSWAVRYRSKGKPRKHTLGAYPGVKLADARILAAQVMTAVADGRDPSAEKKQAKREAAEGFKDDVMSVVEAYLERQAQKHLRKSSLRRVEGLLSNDVIAAWKGRSIKSITKRDVNELLDAAIKRGATVTANRLLAVVRHFFNWCVERDLIEKSPIAGIKAPTAEKSRERILSDEELGLVWKASDRLGWPFGPFVHLLILTGQRRDEVAGMRWSELDIANATWTIPRERVKNDKAHVVPLSPEAVAIIEGLPRMKDGEADSAFVFTTTGKTAISGFSKAKASLDKAITKLLKREDEETSKNEEEEAPSIPDWRLHDLRRTMTSGMARLGVPVHVVEKLLNHTSGTFSGIVSVYQRHEYADEKRQASEAWGSHVAQLTMSAPFTSE
ncbi:integrase arm-type DNA-binding domain-containing protein [Xanthobacter sp. V3C-3]|uniref:tyrosine-type recombinase/integrase n=1 Tax=Xanthobacter lutulentifluminis TaxID=3119935 RepID=UPI00372B4381